MVKRAWPVVQGIAQIEDLFSVCVLSGVQGRRELRRPHRTDKAVFVSRSGVMRRPTVAAESPAMAFCCTFFPQSWRTCSMTGAFGWALACFPWRPQLKLFVSITQSFSFVVKLQPDG
jgi:hypothetical protein